MSKTKRFRDRSVNGVIVMAWFQGVCHANHIRKMQASFSWDWGPAAPSVGLWQPAQLVGYDAVRFRQRTFIL
jgi:hypothetical protein